MTHWFNIAFMKRTPEPELMETMEQAEAYDQADFSEAHGRRVDLFHERYGRELAGAVLDIGCGSGDILERFAKKFPKASFTGVDGSEPMLELSRRRMAKAGLSKRMSFVRAFIPSDDVPKQGYSVIMSHSLLHHLHEPSVLWNTVKQLAGKNTFIFIADLRRPKSEAEAARIVDKISSNEPEVLKRDFHSSLCAAFTAEEIRAQLKAAGLLLKVEEVGEIHVLVYG
jgi:ubiquinone/menaquinone biosynthesis C-methylase UbiE